MTTIAYSARLKTLAADRRVSAHGYIKGQATKIIRVGPIMAAGSGCAPLVAGFLDWVRGGCIDEPPRLMISVPGNSPDDYVRAGGYIFWGHRVIEFFPEGQSTIEIEDFFVAGSGGDTALGALYAGASPARAVELASRYDSATGDGIDVLRMP